ncbi:sigma-54 factor interaction domain-containing protein [Gemmatirosa kalamazoonensis]|uniref:Sigma-54 factor interaction domain-containing protein n=1 Tax=Gemmatirosa kalamazoonensis TaxID=861299 RepID=W0RC56_9BACT|nr:sigma-54 factor interaction domain-containing protein [Gemmatirosa kalamazoonensis]
MVVTLSDSFVELWAQLAEAMGLRLEAVDTPAALDRRTNVVAVIAAGGAEETLVDAMRQVAGGDLEVAAVGALPSHRTAAAVVRAGAAEYFAVPQDLDLLRAWIAERAERLRERTQGLAFAAVEAHKYRFDGILGESTALMKALGLAARVIPHPNVTVLITGETGTGKELLARAIHYNGPRAAAAFVDINCAALPETLLESELFGHEKGAFTDASASKPGLFELADGGTVFLDEIGHLALPLQAKLLRALQERQIRRVGGTRAIPVDVRIIAATHVDLAAAVRAGSFREDLYYRLNVVPVELPPLRARQQDVAVLARHFLSHFAAEYGVGVTAFSPAADRLLRERDWPGNIRELRNAVERAVLLATASVIDADALASPATAHATVDGTLPFPAPLDEIVHAAVVRTLERCGGNKSEAARRLGISRPRLLRLLGEDAGADGSFAADADDAMPPNAVRARRA